MKRNPSTMSRAEAAQMCGLSQRTLYDRIHAGQIATDEHGRVLRAPLEAQIRQLAAIAKGETL